jgi:hypothetical protein
VHHIQSIITFNSATAGDFLMSVCCSQLQGFSLKFTQLESGRMIVNNTYFKKTSQELYYKKTNKVEWDFTKIYPVENSHFWIDAYRDLASTCVYINYPHQVQESIMDVYIEKVFDNDMQKMLDHNLPNMIPALRSKITVDNAKQVCNMLWLKNLKGWSNNSNLTPIELKDFFYKDKLEAIVKMLINNKITNQLAFNEIYNSWISKNTKLRNLFL